MSNLSEFQSFLKRIHSLTTESYHLMEVCGTHTVSISKSGLRSQLPSNLRLLSGPGCPVCVTPVSIIDLAIELSQQPKITVFTFGDMLKVPGSFTTLQKSLSNGGHIKVVYSPLEALEFAKNNPNQEVVFIGVGFETTLPILAATLQRSKNESIQNFSMLAAGKLVPPAMSALMEDPQVRIDGFLCPGHVSTIIGSQAYQTIVEKYGVPCVIVGFLPLDIVEGIWLILKQLTTKTEKVEIQYRRAVTPVGNKKAIDAIFQVFEVVDTEWRGLGIIPNSGVQLRNEYQAFDAMKKFHLKIENNSSMPLGCHCGEVMKGKFIPPECPIFGKQCTPTHPVGPCMVSSEGACAAYYHFENIT